VSGETNIHTQRRSTNQGKTTATLFEIADPLTTRPWQRVAAVIPEATEDSVTGVAGIALLGELLDRLGLVGEAERRNLRPIGPGGDTGGECDRPVVELQLAEGDVLSDRSLPADEATMRLRGSHALPSYTTLFRFLAGADLGRVQKAAAVNRAMLWRAWAMRAAPVPGIVTDMRAQAHGFSRGSSERMQKQHCDTPGR
jgi:hypothetical protein